MFAFRKALPQALHQKIMGISPQPATLDDLADKAREFDRVWRLYTNPAFVQGGRHGPANRAMTTEEDTTQVNATTTRPQIGGKLSKEEKDRRFKEKLCFYCGKPGHSAKECRTKKYNQSQGTRRPGTSSRPRSDFKVQAMTTQEDPQEATIEDHPAQIAAVYQSLHPCFITPGPSSTSLNEDF
jgi:hypothetical protein